MALGIYSRTGFFLSKIQAVQWSSFSSKKYRQLLTQDDSLTKSVAGVFLLHLAITNALFTVAMPFWIIETVNKKVQRRQKININTSWTEIDGPCQISLQIAYFSWHW